MKFASRVPHLALLFLLIVSPAFAFPQRIISTMPSITETLFAIGLGNRVVGVTTNCNYPPEAKKKEKVGQMVMNLEKIVSLKPDLIIMVQDAQQYDVWRLKGRGLPVVTINPHSVKDVMDSIKYIGSITGATYEARTLVNRLNYRLEKVENITKGKIPKSAFVMVGYRPLVTTGKNTFVNDIITRAGFQNSMQSGGEYPQVNFEELYRMDPDIVIIPIGLVSSYEVQHDAKLSRLTAVSSGKMLWIDPDIFFRPGPRVVDAVEQISGFLFK